MNAEQEYSISAALREMTLALYPVAKEEAALQSRLLLCQLLDDIDPSQLLLSAYKPFPEDKRELLAAAVERRRSGEPLQYILGEWDFMGLTFAVRRGTLIPRQDTETLCEHALELIAQRNYKTVLDMCCGTGCIGLSLAKLSGVSAALSDISESCLALAGENALALGLSARVIKSDLFAGIAGAFDIITCNPPYIPAAEIQHLQPELAYEPLLALAGGTDGLDFYRRIAADWRSCINPRGILLMEVGAGQAEDVLHLFGGGYTLKDICGIDRVVAVEA